MATAAQVGFGSAGPVRGGASAFAPVHGGAGAPTVTVQQTYAVLGTSATVQTVVTSSTPSNPLNPHHHVGVGSALAGTQVPGQHVAFGAAAAPAPSPSAAPVHHVRHVSLPPSAQSVVFGSRNPRLVAVPVHPSHLAGAGHGASLSARDVRDLKQNGAYKRV